MSTIYGYCRVSTKGQAKEGNSLDAQEKAIREKYENAIIMHEAYTGTTTDRPIFSKLIEQMEKGDTLVVAKLDRLARNTVEGIEIIKSLFEKGCSVYILNVGLLENTTMGQFFITTLLAVAELERNQIIERTQSGKAEAKAKAAAEGRKFVEGRPQKYTAKQIENALNLLNDNSYKVVSEITGMSVSTLTRLKRQAKASKL